MKLNKIWIVYPITIFSSLFFYLFVYHDFFLTTIGSRVLPYLFILAIVLLFVFDVTEEKSNVSHLSLSVTVFTLIMMFLPAFTNEDLFFDASMVEWSILRVPMFTILANIILYFLLYKEDDKADYYYYQGKKRVKIVFNLVFVAGIIIVSVLALIEGLGSVGV